MIVVTMGDPAGVGPEITLHSLQYEELFSIARLIVVGSLDVLQEATRVLNYPIDFHVIEHPDEGWYREGVIDLIDLNNISPNSFFPGEVSAEAGRASVEYVILATRMALEKKVDAIVTGPINKEAIRTAGYHYIGHTEILADLTGQSRCTTMLVTGQMRVVHVTRHIPFKDISGFITKERVLDTIALTDAGMRDWGFDRPRLGVAALNPHGGDGGLMGQEEILAIEPAVRQAQFQGIDARGPFPADSVFVRALHGEFDCVVAMYHDQGHIPIKVYGFEKSITITLGLPIIRTSVDHGTAFDIAWKGKADPQSMVEAIRVAANLASRK